MSRNWFWRRSTLVASLVCASCAVSHARAGDGTPVKGPLETKWTKDVKPEAPLPEYPRPQMVRTDWANLNGVWQFAMGKEGDPTPLGKDLDDKILVPYPVESALSGIMKPVETGSGLVSPDLRRARRLARPEAGPSTSARWTGSRPSGSTARSWGLTRGV